MDNKLTFSQHTNSTVVKANQVVGMIRRSFKYMDKYILCNFFTSRVRPILECGNVIWNPRLIRDIDAVGRVQRRATKTVPGISTMSYSDRLRTLRLPSLVYRRARGDMIETYKFLHNVYDLNNEWLRRDPSTRTRGHSLKLEKRRCQNTMRQHCFSNRVINNWNSLPESIISAPTVNSFKSKLDQHWYNHIYSTAPIQ